MLVFDRSGSMNDDGGEPVQPLSDAKEAAQSFVASMKNDDQVGLVSFATVASDPIDQVLTSDLASVGRTIGSVAIAQPDGEQHTNLGDAIAQARTELTSSRANEESKAAMIVLTDGIATRPLDPDNPENTVFASDYAATQAKLAREADISIHAIGLGNSVNDEYLVGNIASSDMHYYKAANSSDLKDIYADIAQAVCREDVFTVDFFIRSRNVQ
jgi:Mg-chelatase subunit ChlD